jgi:hypothetical protein
MKVLPANIFNTVKVFIFSKSIYHKIGRNLGRIFYNVHTAGSSILLLTLLALCQHSAHLKQALTTIAASSVSLAKGA